MRREPRPLREVATLARHCSGGLILGFSQFETRSGEWKTGTSKAKAVAADETVRFPSPWNHLEAGILFLLRAPLLVFHEEGITGGVFDPGVTDLFVNPMPRPPMSAESKAALRAVFRRWSAQVRAHYYAER